MQRIELSTRKSGYQWAQVKINGWRLLSFVQPMDSLCRRPHNRSRMNAKASRVLIVDDHVLFRESLGRLLEFEPSLTVVGQCDSVCAALDFMRSNPVDLVLLDYALEAMPGIELLRRLHNDREQAKVLVVTAGISDPATVDIFSAGAGGVFLKCSSAVLLLEAMHTVLRGEAWLDKAALRALIANASREHPQTNDASLLSLREHHVLSDILAGLANKEIAWKRELSLTTVKNVIQQLFIKASARTRGELVRVALEKHRYDWLANNTECGHKAIHKPIER
jgi:two-component system nitrate/nitrite response regulator NarL